MWKKKAINCNDKAKIEGEAQIKGGFSFIFFDHRQTAVLFSGLF